VRDGKSPRSNLPAWLYRVAHNLVVDAFRRMPREELELVEWLEGDEPDPDQTIEQRMQLDRVRLGLRQRTAGQQQVIVLKFFQGMDSREVANIMGRSEGAIDALQHRALRALRKALGQEPGAGAKGDAAGGRSGKDDTQHRTNGDSPTSMTTTQMLRQLLEFLLPAPRYTAVVRSLPQSVPNEAHQARLSRKVTRWQPA